MTFAIFDETFYLNSYPDIRAAVAAGGFVSGLEHFQRFGLQEGRTLVSPYWNEAQYLAANPDVRNAVTAGSFRSGLQHFILYGEAEGRAGAPVVPTNVGFNEDYYLSLYQDVGPLVASRQFPSAEAHYIRLGQFENKLALSSGSRGNDIVTGNGPVNGIVGVGLDVFVNRGAPDPRPTSLGVGETDMLIGTFGNDSFILGFGRTAANPVAQRLYVGGGNSDYAYIKYFERGKDSIQLTGTVNDYILTAGSFAAIGNRASGVSISTSTGDLVALVEGVQSLQLADQDTNQGIFFLG